MTSYQSTTQIPEGVRYARLAGKLLGILLICIGVTSVFSDSADFFQFFKAGYFISYGILLNFPFTHIRSKKWNWTYGLLVFSSVIFVFVMVISVIFNYMEADARGERLGVPGFEGTLIFFALLQIPTVFFQHKPDLLD